MPIIKSTSLVEGKLVDIYIEVDQQPEVYIEVDQQPEVYTALCVTMRYSNRV